MSLCEKVKEYIAQGWKVIDVRTPGEYAQGRIEGAELVPMQEVPNLTEGKYLVYCRSGARSGSAAQYLSGKEGVEALNIGGINQYMGCLEY
jgi:rhodanese-related sulfurtransferase